MDDHALIRAVTTGLSASVGIWLARRYHGARLHVQLAAALERGSEEARSLLDRQIPPLEELPTFQAQRQAHRAAALGLLGDREAVEREAARHVGALHTWGFVGAASWMAFVVAGGSPERALTELGALEERLAREERLILRHALKRLRRARLLVEALQAQVDPTQLQAAARAFMDEQGCVGLVAAALWERTCPGAAQAGLDDAGRKLLQVASRG